MNIPIDWNIVAPAVIVLAGALIALLVDAFYPRRTWNGSGFPSCAALLGAGAAALSYRSDLGRFSFALIVIIIVGTLFVVVASNVMNFETAMPPGEYHFLVMSAAAGALVMVVARDLVTLVISLELLSLPSIALVGLRQGDKRAIRSAWTFFLASAVSTAITLMGISLLYGITGSMDYVVIRDTLARTDMPHGVVAVAVVLTLIGLLFKLGAVPFHVWIPDAYTGASVMVAGFLSTVSKAAALGTMLILVLVAFPYVYDVWEPLFAVVAAVTMTIGNLGALRQSNAIGMLAWSSVAQAGFLIAPAVALLSGGGQGLTAPVQYLAVYAVANLVAFAALAIMLRLRGSTDFEALRGMVRSDPWMGLPLAFATLVLAGFPPAVIGLVTKYIVLQPVIDGGYTWLAVVMGINIMLGLAYYVKFIVVLCDRPDGEPYHSPSPPVSVRIAKTTVLLGTAALIAMSVYPDLLLSNLP